MSGLACLIAVHEVLGSNHAVGNCVYRKNHCDLQPWERAVCTLCAHSEGIISTNPQNFLQCLGQLSLVPSVGR